MESIIGIADQAALYEATRPTFLNVDIEGRSKEDKVTVVYNAVDYWLYFVRPDFISLVDGYGMDTVCRWAMDMLCQGIYHSPRKAAKLFGRAGSKPGADYDSQSGMDACPTAQQAASSPVSPPFPIYLPFRVQHNLMTSLQRALEHGCFTFWQNTAPKSLIARVWTCPEAVELSEWVSIFRREWRDDDWFIYSSSGGKLAEDLFKAIASIRNAAVHRLPVTSRGLEQHLRDGAEFLDVLGNMASYKGFNMVQHYLAPLIEDLGRTRDYVRHKIENNAAALRQQRATLEREEEHVLANRRSGYTAYRDMAKEERQREGERRTEKQWRFDGVNLIEVDTGAMQRMYDTETMSERDEYELGGDGRPDYEENEMDEECEALGNREEYGEYGMDEESEVLGNREDAYGGFFEVPGHFDEYAEDWVDEESDGLGFFEEHEMPEVPGNLKEHGEYGMDEKVEQSGDFFEVSRQFVEDA